MVRRNISKCLTSVTRPRRNLENRAKKAIVIGGYEAEGSGPRVGVFSGCLWVIILCLFCILIAKARKI
jgi:hypothetical protein